MKQVIGIAGQESEYWFRLMDYINEYGEIDVFICTRTECLQEELEHKKPAVLFREKGFADDIVFSGKEVYFSKEKDCIDGIYMYQAADQLYADMRSYIHTGHFEQVELTESNKRVYAVYSPLGRSGKTSFALAFAKKYSFFYFGMEEYGIQGERIHSVDEILYYIQNRKTDIVKILLEYGKEWQGVQMIDSPYLFYDLKKLTMEDYRWFINKIRQEEFPSLFVDLGTGCLPDFEFLDLFDRIYVPVLEGKKEKVQMFWELMREFYGELEPKYRVIHVPEMDWKDPHFLELVEEETSQSKGIHL